MAARRTWARVEVAAHDASAALVLERRLAHLTPTAVGRRGGWVVEVDTDEPIDELEAVVRCWLSDIGRTSTIIRVDGMPRVVRVALPKAAEPPHRAVNASFIG